ncbi:hypothetical protein Taro_027292 [Colocasia esculenta]|uniref:Uncharacterized protein n=1 Tax=Colocasia esculenta TaxID=4460 RepID=A0A843VM33_COLES|nr:hypothetical protein [Colocasia esculenta]
MQANELFVGRLAQLGISFSIIGKIITGKEALAQLNIETWVPISDIETGNSPEDVNKGGLEGREVLHPQIVRTGVRPMKRLEVDVYLDAVSCKEQAFGRLEVSIKSASRSHCRACSLPVAASQSPLSEREATTHSAAGPLFTDEEEHSRRVKR